MTQGNIKRQAIQCAIALAAFLCFALQAHASMTIIRGGAVELAPGAKSGATAVVLVDGKIAYVGNDKGAMAFQKPDARLIDAGGHTIMPTMTEAHIHIHTALKALYEVSLDVANDIADLQKAIKRFADEHPNLKAINGGGWAVSAFDQNGPTKEMIDAVVSDRPVALQSADGHSAWVNAKALAMLGIDKAFARSFNADRAAKGGSIVVDANGNPTGYLKESAAQMIGRLRPTYSLEQCKEALRKQQRWLAGLGFTSAFDAGGLNANEETSDNMYRALSEMARDGELKMKIRGSFWVLPYQFKNWDECQAYLDRWMKKIEFLGANDYYTVTTVKIMSDQVLEEGTAYLSEGMYAKGVLTNNDIESNNIWAGKEEILEKVFEYAATHGLNLHIHQIGDAAATLVLDALEKAVRVYPDLKNQRVSLAHCQFINERDKTRMARLGVSAIVAPYWAVMDDYYWDVYLPLMSSQAKLDKQYPMRSLINHGINVAFHSDYFVTTPDMGYLFYSAMTRVLPQKIYNEWYGDSDEYFRTTDMKVSQKPKDNKTRKVIGPLKPWNETMTLDQTLEAATINGAKTINLDDRIGTIEVGKATDVMILNMNLRKARLKNIENVSPVVTFFEGEPVFVSSTPGKVRFISGFSEAK